MSLMPRWVAGVGICLTVVLGGCAQLPEVQPWEKGMMAKPYMLLDDDPLEQKLIQHIYFSKESASGGSGVGGGGCGCN